MFPFKINFGHLDGKLGLLIHVSRPDRRCSLKVIHKEGGSKLESESSLQGQNQSINKDEKKKFAGARVEKDGF